MRYTPSSYRIVFYPKLTGFTVVIIGLLIALGCWQLRRANEKKRIETQYHRRAQRPTLTWHAIEDLYRRTSLASLRYRRVRVRGRYDTERSILLDNQWDAHRRGYHVVSPFVVSSTSSSLPRIVLVNRGWIESPPLRGMPIIPAIKTPIQTIVGRITIPEKNPLLLGFNDWTPHAWPWRVPKLKLSGLSKGLKESITPFVIQLDRDQPNGLIRHWHPIVLSSRRHISYALQWFAFALIALIIYSSLSLRKQG